MNHVGSPPADGAVVDALRRGDEDAFTRLVNQHHGMLRRIARLYVSSAAVADEVVQDTWLAVIQGVWAFEGRSTLKTWILRILINRAKTRAVRERRNVPIEAAAADGAPPAEEHGFAWTTDEEAEETHAGARPMSREGVRDPRARDPRQIVASPEAGLLSREARARIRSVIDGLPANQRRVITMRDLEGCTSEEVCNVLRLSETNQRVLLHRARTAVRTRLKSYLGRE